MFDVIRNIMESTLEKIMNWAVPLDTFPMNWDDEEDI